MTKYTPTFIINQRISQTHKKISLFDLSESFICQTQFQTFCLSKRQMFSCEQQWKKALQPHSVHSDTLFTPQTQASGCTCSCTGSSATQPHFSTYNGKVHFFYNFCICASTYTHKNLALHLRVNHENASMVRMI